MGRDTTIEGAEGEAGDSSMSSYWICGGVLAGGKFVCVSCSCELLSRETSIIGSVQPRLCGTVVGTSSSPGPAISLAKDSRPAVSIDSLFSSLMAVTKSG